MSMKDATKQALEALGVDLDQTLARFVGNEGMMFRFLKRLPDELTYGKLEAAIQAEDAEDGFHQAHTLKGVAGNLGLGNLFTAIDPLVEALRAGRMEDAKAYFPPVQAAYDQAIATITAIGDTP